MKKMRLGQSMCEVPNIGVGCMRLAGMEQQEVERFIEGALEVGLNFFDHADIYGKGESERIFAQAVGMNASKREKFILQSKCGIRAGRYDFSKAYILASVDDILQRLQTDYLDVFLLHRPDILMDPEEVAEAFALLTRSGKVRHFGVSNHNAGQLALLQKYVGEKMVVNQLQFGLAHTALIDAGVNVNTNHASAASRDGGTLDYMRMNNMTMQAWSPFQVGMFEGVFFSKAAYAPLMAVVERLAQEHHVTVEAIAVAWILRHPAHIQAIVGTTSVTRLQQIAQASELELSREEWYELYRAAGNELP